MPDGEGGFAELALRPRALAYSSERFFTSFGHMLLTTRKTASWNSDYEAGLLQTAMKRHEVTIREAYDGFWKAYSDPYTPASGIEWRHLWKHIEKMRKGRDLRYYSYREMLNTVDEESISTDHFEYDEQEAVRQRKEFPDKPTEDLKVWKRK